MKILNYLEEMSNSSSLDDLFDLYRKSTSEYGYDRIMYSSVSNDIENDHNKTPCLVQNYPEDWMKHYIENGYIQIDPVRRRGCHSTEPFTWKSLKDYSELSKKQEIIMSMAEEAGLHDGIGIPYRTPRGEIIGVGIASSAKGTNPEEHIGKLYMLTSHFHFMYQALLEKNIIKTDDDFTDISLTPLTPREQDVLLWCMKGKSNWDISMILNVSEHCIDFHMRNILRKLNTNSRLTAVVKAMRIGLIKP
ncbi:MAG: LuxR family transcriptional regulator [Alphaproteobacteria bacterium]|nr:LuxR family transcriptional regulator [Alphaproteobacteria bacterium]